jgi:hypothetical protein
LFQPQETKTMLIHPGPQFQRISSSYQGNPASNLGTTITAGASNADGSWAQFTFVEGVPSGSAAALRHDVHFIEMWMSGGGATTVDTSTTLELGIDAAGGTSYTSVIEGIQCGFLGTNSLALGSQSFRNAYFPLWIPAGATVAMRGRNVTGSTKSIIIGINMYGDPRHSERWWCGQKCDTFGYVAASSGGTAVAPNASANTLGSWTNIGSTTSYRYDAVSITHQGATGGDVMASIAYGVEFGCDSSQISNRIYFGTLSTELCNQFLTPALLYRNIPVGAQMQLRTIASNASAVSPQFAIHAFR